MSIGLLLIAAALFWTIHNIREDERGGEASGAALEQLLLVIPTAPSEPVGTQTVPTEPTDLSEVEYPDYVLNPEMEMPETEIDGQQYIGILQIPALEMEYPIITMWSDKALKIAPCRYSGSVYLDNMVIAGHNYKSHFSNLGNVCPGDEVTFTDVDGNVFRYEVVCIEMLEADAVEEMVNSPFDLSLFSCTRGGEYRRTVRCDRIDR